MIFLVYPYGGYIERFVIEHVSLARQLWSLLHLSAKYVCCHALRIQRICSLYIVYKNFRRQVCLITSSYTSIKGISVSKFNPWKIELHLAYFFRIDANLFRTTDCILTYVNPRVYTLYIWSVMWTRDRVKRHAYFSKYMHSDLSNIFIHVCKADECMHETRLFVHAHINKMDAYLSVFFVCILQILRRKTLCIFPLL